MIVIRLFVATGGTAPTGRDGIEVDREREILLAKWGALTDRGRAIAVLEIVAIPAASPCLAIEMERMKIAETIAKSRQISRVLGEEECNVVAVEAEEII